MPMAQGLDALDRATELADRAVAYRHRYRNRRILVQQWAKRQVRIRPAAEPLPEWARDKRTAEDVHAYARMMARRRYPSMLRPIYVGRKLINAASVGGMLYNGLTPGEPTLVALGLACPHGLDPDSCMRCAPGGLNDMAREREREPQWWCTRYGGLVDKGKPCIGGCAEPCGL